MGKNLQKQFSFRTDDDLILKINYIAEHNTRTRNKEIEHVLKNHVSEFEKEHGELIIKDNGQIELAKPQILDHSQSYNSKSG